MDPFRLLDFQVTQLGYHFKDIDLLQEALTHSLDHQDIVVHFPNQNRTFSNRLQIIGNAVIKFTISQFAVQTLDVTAIEGRLTGRKDSVVNGAVQKSVGERLFAGYAIPRGNLWNYLRAGKSFKLNHDQNQTVPYEKVVRALMGAVYLDAGGISGDGLEASGQLFRRIWGKELEKMGYGGLSSSGSIRASFPGPSENVIQFWTRKGLGKGFIQAVEHSIGAVVQRGHLLAEALIHKTFYDGISGGGQGEGQHLPDYQRMEFLGDSVLGLVITEIMWMKHSFDSAASEVPLDHKITALIEAEAQRKIFEKLRLKRFVRMKEGGIPEWSNHDDIVESIVGAIFVDGGGIAAKDFILKTWNLEEDTREPDLEDLQGKLGYKFQNNEFLRRALTVSGAGLYSEEQITDRSKKLREVLVYFGKSWIQFHATEYTLRTCDPNDSLPILVHRRNHLCGEKVLLRIATHLNLSKYVTLSRDQQNRGLEPYMFYVEVIQAISGAVFKDMQEAGIKMSFGRIFYRLWNQFLGKRPTENLQDNFSRSGLPSNSSNALLLREFQMPEMEGYLRHSFAHPHLLQEIIPPIGMAGISNSARFSFLGESLMDLAIRVYVAILCHMNLQDPGSDPSSLDLNSLHARLLSECLDFGDQELYEPELLQECIVSRAAAMGLTMSRISKDELTKRVLGAVYVDISKRSADLSFSDWKQYFMIRCEFITGKPRETTDEEGPED